jgi:hypothetical protein
MLLTRIFCTVAFLFLLSASSLCAQVRGVPDGVDVTAVVDTAETRVRILSRVNTGARTATLAGAVTNAEGRPLAAAQVILRGTRRGGFVDHSGEFRYEGLPPDLYHVEVHRIGNAPEAFTLRLEAGETVRVEIPLEISPVHLEGVEVTAEARPGQSRMAGFLARKERRRGYFFTRGDIERRKPRHINDLLATLPRIRLVWIEGENVIRMRGQREAPARPVGPERVMESYTGQSFSTAPATMRGGSGETVTSLSEGDCPPLYFVDGMSFDPTQGPPPNHVRPEEVQGIEVYEAGRVAVQFRRRGAECGVIVIWTRNPWNF